VKLHIIVVIAIILTLGFSSCRKETVWKPKTPFPKEAIKVAVIHPNEIDHNSHYDYNHYKGTVEMQRNIGLTDGQVIRKINVLDDNPVLAEAAIRDCITAGANVVIVTTIGHMVVCEKLAPEFPSVIFIAGMGHHYNDTNYTGYTPRLYQARYLSGIVAGMRTQSGRIGYVSAMGDDNSEVTGGINAFAIGVEEVNPQAQIVVRVTRSWYDPLGEANAANALIAAGCDVIAAHCDTSVAQVTAQRAGVWSIGFNSDMSSIAPNAVITSVIPLWGILYTHLIESIIDGSFTPAAHFYGLAEGAVDITPLNDQLAVPGMEAAVRTARQRIIREGYNVFDGALETNDGRTVGKTGETLADDIILTGIDWYYRNVEVLK
jgi:basic membrane protein A